MTSFISTGWFPGLRLSGKIVAAFHEAWLFGNSLEHCGDGGSALTKQIRLAEWEPDENGPCMGQFFLEPLKPKTSTLILDTRIHWATKLGDPQFRHSQPGETSNLFSSHGVVAVGLLTWQSRSSPGWNECTDSRHVDTDYNLTVFACLLPFWIPFRFPKCPICAPLLCQQALARADWPSGICKQFPAWADSCPNLKIFGRKQLS